MKQLVMGMMVFCYIVATSAAAWCADNGTITIGNLVVLKIVQCLGKKTWADAVARVNTLADGQCKLTDKSKAGSWRLPTIDELKAIYFSRNLFGYIPPGSYWSSSDYPNRASAAYYFSFGTNGGQSGGDSKAVSYYVWPVRNK